MLVCTDCNMAHILVQILDGATVVFPTETSYGLGCDATNQTAVDELYAIKNRPSDKPLLIVVSTVEEARRYVVWNDKLDMLAERYWPGPLTVVGEFANNSQFPLAQGVVSSQNTVAVRVTNHPFLVSLLELVRRPLVATSANLSDAGNVYDIETLKAMFRDRAIQPDLVLDHGHLPETPSTTLVSVVGGELQVLRQGELYIEG